MCVLNSLFNVDEIQSGLVMNSKARVVCLNPATNVRKLVLKLKFENVTFFATGNQNFSALFFLFCFVEANSNFDAC